MEDATVTVMRISLCVIGLLVLAIAGPSGVCNATISCITVSEYNSFPATSDASGCPVLSPPRLACPSGQATGGGCACADCGPLQIDKPKDGGWKCGYTQIDDLTTHMCDGSASVVTYIICCQ